MIKYVIGIDPGMTGGCTAIQENNIDFFPMKSIGKEFDIKYFTEILNKYAVKETHIFLERIHALFGSSAGNTFKFGRVYGIMEGIISALNFPYTLVPPKTWQKEIFEGITEIRKPSIKKNKYGDWIKGKRDTKKMAEVAVNRLGNIDVISRIKVTEKGNISKNMHSGLMDSYLIALYGKRKLNIL